jgi:hypothetical protein
MARANKRTAAGRTYNIEDILKVQIHPQTLRCEFDVKWEGYDDPEDRTWEPLENVTVAPVVLHNLIVKSRNKLLRAAGGGELPSDAVAQSIPNFPKISSEILRKMRATSDPDEFFPEGTEGFVRVVDERIGAKSGVPVWFLEFENETMTAPRWVRRDIAAYYWPEDAALAAIRLNEKQQKFERFMAEREAHAKKAKKQ